MRLGGGRLEAGDQLPCAIRKFLLLSSKAGQEGGRNKSFRVQVGSTVERQLGGIKVPGKRVGGKRAAQFTLVQSKNKTKKTTLPLRQPVLGSLL